MFALRTVIALAFAGIAGTTVASAADLPSRSTAYAPSYSPSLSNWQGFYVGAHLGGGFGSVGPVDTSGILAGLQGGYNHQIDRFVIGGEADITWSDISNSGFTEKARNDWLGTIRGRAGYSFGNVLAYGTVGVAFANAKYSNVFGVTENTVSGWTIGAGAEMMVTNNISLRAEYLRYQLGNTDYPIAGGIGKVDNNINVIRAGASYKF